MRDWGFTSIKLICGNTPPEVFKVPTYGYKCARCSHTFEVFQKITDQPLNECGECGGEVRRLIYPVGIAFKGSGFHINDYKSPGKADDSKPDIPAPETKAKDTVEAK